MNQWIKEQDKKSEHSRVQSYTEMLNQLRQKEIDLERRSWSASSKYDPFEVEIVDDDRDESPVSYSRASYLHASDKLESKSSVNAVPNVGKAKDVQVLTTHKTKRNRRRKKSRWQLDDGKKEAEASNSTKAPEKKPGVPTSQVPAQKQNAAKKIELKVKTQGVMFGNLNPVVTNPVLDPPPYVCYNCWQRGHSLAHCPRPTTQIFCFNCGRRGVDLSNCPRCAKVHVEYVKKNFSANLAEAVKNSKVAKELAAAGQKRVREPETPKDAPPEKKKGNVVNLPGNSKEVSTDSSQRPRVSRFSDANPNKLETQPKTTTWDPRATIQQVKLALAKLRPVCASEPMKRLNVHNDQKSLNTENSQFSQPKIMDGSYENLSRLNSEPVNRPHDNQNMMVHYPIHQDGSYNQNRMNQSMSGNPGRLINEPINRPYDHQNMMVTYPMNEGNFYNETRVDHPMSGNPDRIRNEQKNWNFGNQDRMMNNPASLGVPYNQNQPTPKSSYIYESKFKPLQPVTNGNHSAPSAVPQTQAPQPRSTSVGDVLKLMESLKDLPIETQDTVLRSVFADRAANKN